MMETLSLYCMAILYFMAGIMHFLKPKLYKRIIPPFFKNKDLINRLSGGAEIILAVGLLTPLQSFAAWGIILLLIAVFPANIYHLQQKGAGMKVPLWVLWLRLPLQILLIWWAYQFT